MCENIQQLFTAGGEGRSRLRSNVVDSSVHAYGKPYTISQRKCYADFHRVWLRQSHEVWFKPKCKF